MHIISNFGLIVLAVWLIVTCACELFSIGNPTLNSIMNIVGIIAGILILLGR